MEDIILDALIPPIKNQPATQPQPSMAQGEPATDAELNERTRERFREKIRNGELDDRKIEIRISAISQSKHSLFERSFDKNYSLSFAAPTKLPPTTDLKASQSR